MGITNKAISTKFLNIIIRTKYGQTEIVMQYGGLWSSVTCVTTSCSNAAPVVFPRWILSERGEHVYRVHLIDVQLVTDPAKEGHGYDSGSESFDKHEPRDILHCHVERRYQSFAVAERAV